MKKLFFAAVEFLIILTTIGALLMSTGCSTKGSETTTTAQAEGFAIYLTKDNLTADKMPPTKSNPNRRYAAYRHERHHQL